MADTSGRLSQAVANLQALSDHLGALSGLPPGGDAARSAVQTSVKGAIPAVVASSRTMLDFVDATRPLLATAATALDAQDAPGLRTALAAIQSAASAAKASVSASTAVIQTAIDTVHGQIAVLSGIDGTLSAQISEATNEARLAEASAAELDKKKLYWLLLGPFGLIGLGVCIGMIVDSNNRVVGIQARAGALRAEAAQWSRMKADVDLAMSELPQIGARLQSLQNGVDFVSGDISAVIEDAIKGGSGSAIAKAFLMTAGHELDVLTQDAA